MSEFANVTNNPDGSLMQMAQVIAKAIEPFMGDLKTEIADIKSEMHDEKVETRERFRNLEEYEALRDEQVNSIDAELNHHASKLLGITWIRRGVAADECLEDKARYFGRLRAAMIRDFKDCIRCPQSKKWMYISRKHYDEFVEFIRGYEPVGGIEDFKANEDKKISARQASKRQMSLGI